MSPQLHYSSNPHRVTDVCNLQMTFRRIVIIGGGAWGTALAISLSQNLSVSLIIRSPEEASGMHETKENTRYLPGIRIPDTVLVTSDLAPALRTADLVLIATPVSAFESVLTAIANQRTDLPIIWGCKGVCAVTGEPLSLLAEKILGKDACFGVLSGPSFASVLALQHPTAVVVATNSNKKTTLAIARALSNGFLRVYANSDLIGVQICGAIKNVYAIVAGIIDESGWGENTRAAMLTRAIAEAKLYLKKHGCKRSTLMGLSGFGDLYLTCSSRQSRNYQIGMALASNIPLAEAIQSIGHVVEGVGVTRLIQQRASILEIEMPIVAAVNEVISGNKTPHECVKMLMARDIKHEKNRKRSSKVAKQHSDSA